MVAYRYEPSRVQLDISLVRYFTRELSSYTLEEKFHIYARPCIVSIYILEHYLLLQLIEWLSISFKVIPHLSIFLSFSFTILGLVFTTWQKKPYDQQVLRQIFIA